MNIMNASKIYALYVHEISVPYSPYNMLPCMLKQYNLNWRDAVDQLIRSIIFL